MDPLFLGFVNKCVTMDEAVFSASLSEQEERGKNSRRRQPFLLGLKTPSDFPDTFLQNAVKLRFDDLP